MCCTISVKHWYVSALAPKRRKITQVFNLPSIGSQVWLDLQPSKSCNFYPSECQICWLQTSHSGLLTQLLHQLGHTHTHTHTHHTHTHMHPYIHTHTHTHTPQDTHTHFISTAVCMHYTCAVPWGSVHLSRPTHWTCGGFCANSPDVMHLTLMKPVHCRPNPYKGGDPSLFRPHMVQNKQPHQ